MKAGIIALLKLIGLGLSLFIIGGTAHYIINTPLPKEPTIKPNQVWERNYTRNPFKAIRLTVIDTIDGYVKFTYRNEVASCRYSEFLEHNTKLISVQAQHSPVKK